MALLRENETLARVGAVGGLGGDGLAVRNETVDVPAAWASGLQEAPQGLDEGDFVIIDGTLIPTERIAADETAHDTVQAYSTPQSLILADRAYRRARCSTNRIGRTITADRTLPIRESLGRRYSAG